MNTRCKGKKNHLVGPGLTMDMQDAKASSTCYPHANPHANTRDNEHGEEEENTGESFTHILREIQEGNQKFAT